MGTGLEIELPIPAFKIGQEVWAPGTAFAGEKVDCRDCLGSGRWKATTPAGDEYELECLGCDGCGYLTKRKYVANPSKFTVGKITTSTHADSWHESRTTYMCFETGIGTGRIYDEAKLFLHEAGATEASEKIAAEQNKGLDENDKQHGVYRAHEYKFFDLKFQEEAGRRRDAEIERDSVLDDMQGDLEVYGDRLIDLKEALRKTLEKYGREVCKCP